MKRRELLKGAAAAGTAAGFGSLLAGAPSTASAALPVPRPTLPQKIDPISATLRRLELVSRQATYSGPNRTSTSRECRWARSCRPPNCRRSSTSC